MLIVETLIEKMKRLSRTTVWYWILFYKMSHWGLFIFSLFDSINNAGDKQIQGSFLLESTLSILLFDVLVEELII